MLDLTEHSLKMCGLWYKLISLCKQLVLYNDSFLYFQCIMVQWYSTNSLTSFSCRILALLCFQLWKNLRLSLLTLCLWAWGTSSKSIQTTSVLRLCSHLDAKSRLFWNFVFIVFLFWICSTSASFNLPVLSCTFISLHSANWINALSIFIVHYRFDNTNLPLLTISYFHWHQAASLTAPLPPPLHLASCVKS